MTLSVTGKKLFGQGRFFGINNVANPTPARFSLVQDQSVTFKRTVKSLYGEEQLAADVSSGELEVSGKVTYATMNPRITADLMFGIGSAASKITEADNEAGTAVSSAVTVVNSATWTTDLGVVNVATGVRYVRVATTPVAGASYTVAAGVYTFAAGDATVSVRISYLYTTSASGELLTLTNQNMGKVGNFTGIAVFPWGTEQDVLTLNSCLGQDNEISTKGSDYGKPTFSYMAAVDNTDTLGTFSFAEAA